MEIAPAWTASMRRLDTDPDVLAVVEVASIDGVLGTVAQVLRDHWALRSAKLESSLTGAELVLPSLIAAGQGVAEDDAATMAAGAVTAIRSLYANATSNKDLAQKRGKVLELLIYHHIRDTYVGGGMCEMDCAVTGPGVHYARLRGHEFDVCAWIDSNAYGEAYECSVRPNSLESADYTALATLKLAANEEYAALNPSFYVGFASFDHSKYVGRRIEALADAVREDAQSADVLPNGYDNLAKLWS